MSVHLLMFKVNGDLETVKSEVQTPLGIKYVNVDVVGLLMNEFSHDTAVWAFLFVLIIIDEKLNPMWLYFIE